MSAWEMKIIAAEAQRLLALAVQDAGLREELRALAEDILRATEGSPPGTTTPEAVRRRIAREMSPVTRRKSGLPRWAGAGGGTTEGIDVRSVPLVFARDPAGAGGDDPTFCRGRRSRRNRGPAAGSRPRVRAGRRPVSAGFVRGATPRLRSLPRTRRSSPAPIGLRITSTG